MPTNEKKSPRLRLNRETFRRLTTDELNRVNGGRWSSEGPYNEDPLCGCSDIKWDSSLGGDFNPGKCNGQQP